MVVSGSNEPQNFNCKIHVLKTSFFLFSCNYTLYMCVSYLLPPSNYQGKLSILLYMTLFLESLYLYDINNYVNYRNFLSPCELLYCDNIL